MSVHAFALPPRIPTAVCNECGFTYERPLLSSVPVPWEPRSRLVCIDCVHAMERHALELARETERAERLRVERLKHIEGCRYCSRWEGLLGAAELEMTCAALGGK